MGEARRRKLAGGVLKGAAVTEAGRHFLEHQTTKAILAVEAAMMRGHRKGKGIGRVLNAGPGEIFVYFPDDPATPSALNALGRELRRQYPTPNDVPDWLVDLVIEEPWEMVARGREVSLADVLWLHAHFPWYPVGPHETWARCQEKADAVVARAQAERLKERVAARTGTRRSTV